MNMLPINGNNNPYNQYRDEHLNTRYKTQVLSKKKPSHVGVRLISPDGDIVELSSVAPPKSLFEKIYESFSEAAESASDYFSAKAQGFFESLKSSKDLDNKSRDRIDISDSALAKIIAEELIDESSEEADITHAENRLTHAIGEVYGARALENSLGRYRDPYIDFTNAHALRGFFDMVMEGTEPYDAGEIIFEGDTEVKDPFYFLRMVEITRHAKTLIRGVEEKYKFLPIGRGNSVCSRKDAKEAYELVYKNISDTEGLEDYNFSVKSYGGIALGFIVPDSVVTPNSMGETEGMFPMEIIQKINPEEIAQSDYVRELGLLSFRIPQSVARDSLESLVTVSHEMHHIKEKFINYEKALSRGLPGSFNNAKVEMSAEFASNPPTRIYLGSGYESLMLDGDSKDMVKAEKVPEYIKNILQRGIIFDEKGRPNDKAGMEFMAYLISQLKEDEKLPEMLQAFDTFMKERLEDGTSSK